MPRLFDEKIAFNHTDETYIGTWFGCDIWLYNSGGVPNLLAVFGNEPGNYSTWIGDERWFADGAVMGVGEGVRVFGAHHIAMPNTIPMEEHLTTNDISKAFLMGFAAIYARNGGNLSSFEPDKSVGFASAAAEIEQLRVSLVFRLRETDNETANANYRLANAALEQAEQFMRLASFHQH